MITTKIKYCGNWRTVLGVVYKDMNGGMTCNRSAQKCYKVQSLENKFWCNYIPVDDKHIEEIEQKDRKRYPSRNRRYKDLTEKQKEFIYHQYRNGMHYIYEICDYNHITYYALTKIVKEYDQIRSTTKKV